MCSIKRLGFPFNLNKKKSETIILSLSPSWLLRTGGEMDLCKVGNYEAAWCLLMVVVYSGWLWISIWASLARIMEEIKLCGWWLG